MKILKSRHLCEGASANLKLGRLVANYDFLRALLNYGDFDQYHLFCATQGHFTLLKEAIERDVTDPQLRQRIHLKHHLIFQCVGSPRLPCVSHGWLVFLLPAAGVFAGPVCEETVRDDRTYPQSQHA